MRYRLWYAGMQINVKIIIFSALAGGAFFLLRKELGEWKLGSWEFLYFLFNKVHNFITNCSSANCQRIFSEVVELLELSFFREIFSYLGQITKFAVNTY